MCRLLDTIFNGTEIGAKGKLLYHFDTFLSKLFYSQFPRFCGDVLHGFFFRQKDQGVQGRSFLRKFQQNFNKNSLVGAVGTPTALRPLQYGMRGKQSLENCAG